LSSRLIRWLAYLGGWNRFAIFFISEDVGQLLSQGRTVQWHGFLVVWLTTAYAWAFLTPFVWWLASRFPIERTTWRRSAGLHPASSFCFALIEALLFAGITPIFGLPLCGELDRGADWVERAIEERDPSMMVYLRFVVCKALRASHRWPKIAKNGESVCVTQMLQTLGG
jgi:hypothetical protein